MSTPRLAPAPPEQEPTERCPHCAPDKTSQEAIALGRQVLGIRISGPAQRFGLLAPEQALRDIIAWWTANKDAAGQERPRLQVDLLAEPDGLDVRFHPRTYRRRRSRRGVAVSR